MYQLFYLIHLKFKEGHFAEGKHLWFSNYFSNDQKVWDAYGSEEDYSFGKLLPMVTTAYKSVCTGDCTKPVKVMVSKMIGYEYVFMSPHTLHGWSHYVFWLVICPCTCRCLHTYVGV